MKYFLWFLVTVQWFHCRSYESQQVSEFPLLFTKSSLSWAMLCHYYTHCTYLNYTEFHYKNSEKIIWNDYQHAVSTIGVFWSLVPSFQSLIPFISSGNINKFPYFNIILWYIKYWVKAERAWILQLCQSKFHKSMKYCTLSMHNHNDNNKPEVQRTWACEHSSLILYDTGVTN